MNVYYHFGYLSLYFIIYIMILSCLRRVFLKAVLNSSVIRNLSSISPIFSMFLMCVEL